MSTEPTQSTPLMLVEKALAESDMAITLVPMADEFQGEYTPPHASRLPYVTGFRGSAGLGAFRRSGHHALFVDGRYVLQAPAQVDSSRIAVINSGEVSFTQWLEQEQCEGAIGFDPWLITMQQIGRWKKATSHLPVTWTAAANNLVDALWQNRPPLPSASAFLHGPEHTGKTYADKRESLLEILRARKADALLLTAADSINWLLNIRGRDIEFNPLLLAYFLLKADGSAVLYTFPRTWDADVAAYFATERVEVADIRHVFQGKVEALPKAATLMLDPAQAAQGWADLAAKIGWAILPTEDPTLLPKAIKNATELAGIRDAHYRDGFALSQFLGWLDQHIMAGRTIDELGVVEKLDSFRATDTTYRGPSFATIAGCGPNGAIVHYRADSTSNRALRRGELLLLDSGGQYAGGTTDVTRTVYLPISAREGAAGSGLANATPAHLAMKDRYTRVLKGHIALATARFPAGTTGTQLDALARQYLWAVGLDYDHGTGHGVGAYLCVHEGPQRISKRGSDVALKPGMILSNEPGYYEAGSYGIRIENLVEVVEIAPKQLGFETLTLAPIDTRMVEVKLLTTEERNWLNAYHRRVYDAYAATLDATTRDWLLNATRAV